MTFPKAAEYRQGIILLALFSGDQDLSVCDGVVIWGHGVCVWEGAGAVYLGRYQRAGETNPKKVGLLEQRNSWLEGHG